MSFRCFIARCARRFGALAVASLQLAAWSIAPLAEAALDAERASLGLHVESEGNPECPSHDHLFCRVARSIAAASLIAGGAEVEAAPPVLRVASADDGSAVGDRLLTRSASARAPPLA